MLEKNQESEGKYREQRFGRSIGKERNRQYVAEQNPHNQILAAVAANANANPNINPPGAGDVLRQSGDTDAIRRANINRGRRTRGAAAGGSSGTTVLRGAGPSGWWTTNGGSRRLLVRNNGVMQIIGDEHQFFGTTSSTQAAAENENTEHTTGAGITSSPNHTDHIFRLVLLCCPRLDLFCMLREILFSREPGFYYNSWDEDEQTEDSGTSRGNDQDGRPSSSTTSTRRATDAVAPTVVLVDLPEGNATGISDFLDEGGGGREAAFVDARGAAIQFPGATTTTNGSGNYIISASSSLRRQRRRSTYCVRAGVVHCAALLFCALAVLIAETNLPALVDHSGRLGVPYGFEQSTPVSRMEEACAILHSSNEVDVSSEATTRDREPLHQTETIRAAVGESSMHTTQEILQRVRTSRARLRDLVKGDRDGAEALQLLVGTTSRKGRRSCQLLADTVVAESEFHELTKQFEANLARRGKLGDCTRVENFEKWLALEDEDIFQETVVDAGKYQRGAARATSSPSLEAEVPEKNYAEQSSTSPRGNKSSRFTSSFFARRVKELLDAFSLAREWRVIGTIKSPQAPAPATSFGQQTARSFATTDGVADFDEQGGTGRKLEPKIVQEVRKKPLEFHVYPSDDSPWKVSRVPSTRQQQLEPGFPSVTKSRIARTRSAGEEENSHAPRRRNFLRSEQSRSATTRPADGYQTKAKNPRRAFPSTAAGHKILTEDDPLPAAAALQLDKREVGSVGEEHRNYLFQVQNGDKEFFVQKPPGNKFISNPTTYCGLLQQEQSLVHLLERHQKMKKAGQAEINDARNKKEKEGKINSDADSQDHDVDLLPIDAEMPFELMSATSSPEQKQNKMDPLLNSTYQRDKERTAPLGGTSNKAETPTTSDTNTDLWMQGIHSKLRSQARYTLFPPVDPPYHPEGSTAAGSTSAAIGDGQVLVNGVRGGPAATTVDLPAQVTTLTAESESARQTALDSSQQRLRLGRKGGSSDRVPDGTVREMNQRGEHREKNYPDPPQEMFIYT
ncbi:unnamed protein product [Amoebophrya sp. A120]|nr:unnamed protein product [Amoebophrya sp. A120]|eukprot:GSA120T00020470001.1